MVKYKHLAVKRLGWKRICRNTERFGWVLYDAYEHVDVVQTVTKKGIFADQTHVKSTQVSVQMSFYRDDGDYYNLFSIRPLEIIYNILFTIRRIIGGLLPLATLIVVIMSAFGWEKWLFSQSPWGGLYIGAICAWVLFLILESVLPRIAYKKLMVKPPEEQNFIDDTQETK